MAPAAPAAGSTRAARPRCLFAGRGGTRPISHPTHPPLLPAPDGYTCFALMGWVCCLGRARYGTRRQSTGRAGRRRRSWRRTSSGRSRSRGDAACAALGRGRPCRRRSRHVLMYGAVYFHGPPGLHVQMEEPRRATRSDPRRTPSPPVRYAPPWAGGCAGRVVSDPRRQADRGQPPPPLRVSDTPPPRPPPRTRTRRCPDTRGPATCRCPRRAATDGCTGRAVCAIGKTAGRLPREACGGPGLRLQGRWCATARGGGSRCVTGRGGGRLEPDLEGRGAAKAEAGTWRKFPLLLIPDRRCAVCHQNWVHWGRLGRARRLLQPLLAGTEAAGAPGSATLARPRACARS